MIALLIDAQLPPALARHIESLGHRAEHAFDLGLAQTPDDRIRAIVLWNHPRRVHGREGGSRRDPPRARLGWIDWSTSLDIGLDFNPTYFSHPKAADNATLSHADPGIRSFWIRHGIACRKIGEAMGRALGSPCVTNFWIPDGMKDTPVDRNGPRARLVEALDTVFKDPIDPAFNRDSVEGKLFGAVWDDYCESAGVPVGDARLVNVHQCERDALSARASTDAVSLDTRLPPNPPR